MPVSDEQKQNARDERAFVLNANPTFTHTFWCEGCGCYHWLDKRWKLTAGPAGNPTVRASVLVQAKYRCHLFITDGKIQYLSDCTHELAGTTVELTEWEPVVR